MTPSRRPCGEPIRCTAPDRWPLLRLWTALRPNSSAACTMTGWAHQVDGQLDQARSLFQRALDIDPENDEAAQLMDNLPPA